MNKFFKFRQFTIYQDRTAMKVGTDGVLLGAWADLTGARSLLDIGTGTGLIALMLAQRSEVPITAVEIDGNAFSQAVENFRLSPWSERIHPYHTDIRIFAEKTEQRFDCIVSNPPYHTARVISPNQSRHIARHSDALPFGKLLQAVSILLSPDGRFSVILPVETASDFISQAYRNGLYLEKRTQVISRAGKPPKRILLAFCRKSNCISHTDQLFLQTTEGTPTEDMQQLTGAFYL